MQMQWTEVSVLQQVRWQRWYSVSLFILFFLTCSIHFFFSLLNPFDMKEYTLCSIFDWNGKLSGCEARTVFIFHKTYSIQNWISTTPCGITSIRVKCHLNAKCHINVCGAIFKQIITKCLLSRRIAWEKRKKASEMVPIKYFVIVGVYASMWIFECEWHFSSLWKMGTCIAHSHRHVHNSL